MNMDDKNLSILVLLDLSAAFDTVGHDILINRLQKFGASLVTIGDHSSANTSTTCGVPQGSILGPVLFNLYMLPLGNIIREHAINFHSYADDTQLYISLSPNDTSPIDKLVQCIDHINLWTSHNFLQLNQDKTEVLIIGAKVQRYCALT